MNGNNLDDHLRHGIVIENTYGSVLSGNMIEECKEIAIILDRDCYGITISANVIAHNFGGGVDLRDAWGCTVSANTFTIVAQRGLVVGPNSGRITITGNNFSNSHIGGKVKREDAAAGVQLEGTADIVISGNIFSGLARHAIEANDACQRIAIVGNVMSDLGRKSTDRVPALNLGKARETVVENNAIEKGFEAPAGK
jgi:parallel beta-helix repeat protein